jgi:hypothetical protein
MMSLRNLGTSSQVEWLAPVRRWLWELFEVVAEVQQELRLPDPRPPLHALDSDQTVVG